MPDRMKAEPLDSFLKALEEQLKKSPAKPGDREGEMFDKGVAFTLSRVRRHIARLAREQNEIKK